MLLETAPVVGHTFPVFIAGIHTLTRRSSIFCLAALFATGSVTQAETVVVDAFDRGNYTSDGFHREAFENTYTGFAFLPQHSFFAFKLGQVCGRVTSAALTLQMVAYQDPPAEHDVSLQHVSTAVTNVLAGHVGGSLEGQAIFTDLGDGDVYGTAVVPFFPPFSFPSPTLTIPLNQAALDAMTAKVGGDFVIGVKVPSASGPLAAGLTFSGDSMLDPGPWIHRLEITFDPNAFFDFEIAELALENGQPDLIMTGLGSANNFEVKRKSPIAKTGTWQTVHSFVSIGCDTNWVDRSLSGFSTAMYRLEYLP